VGANSRLASLLLLLLPLSLLRPNKAVAAPDEEDVERSMLLWLLSPLLLPLLLLLSLSSTSRKWSRRSTQQRTPVIATTDAGCT